MRLPVGESHLVDLSVLLDEDLPTTWPGHVTFAHKNWTWFEPIDTQVAAVRSLGPYSTNFLTLDEHCGTHLDGPTHFIPPPGSGLPHAGPRGRTSGELLDLEQMWGPAVVIDVSELAGTSAPGTSPFIEPRHVERWEERSGPVAEGSVVLFRTGWDRFYVAGPDGRRYLLDPLVTGAYPGWPAPSPDAMALLHDRGVRLVGTDAPSMGAAHDGAPVHQLGLGRGMYFVEVLTNLDALPERGAFFVFLPLKIAASTGGPGRAVALVPGGAPSGLS